jgi:hypothetical protein
LTVSQKNLTIASAAPSKTYDGTSTINNASLTLGGLVTGDHVSALGSGHYLSKNAANNLNYTLSNVFLSGADSSNYYIPGSVPLYSGTNGLITKANATVTALAQSKTYDATTNVTNSSAFAVSGLLAGEAISNVTLAYADKNAGTGKTIAISNVVGDANTSLANYNITYANNTSSRITKANLTISGQSTAVTYNGSVQTVNGFSVTGLLGTDTVADLTGVVTSGASGKNVGTYTNAVSGTDINYNLSFVNGILSVTPASLTLTALAQSKTYDATVQVSNSSAFTMLGTVAGETISAVTLAYGDKNAGAGNKTIVISNAVAGANTSLSNYNITYVNNTASTITPALISHVSNITALNKTDDGTTSAMLNTSGAVYNGLYAGDQLSVASAVGSFDNLTIGTHKLVTISGITLGGFSAGNYQLGNSTAQAYADLTAKITPSGLTSAFFNSSASENRLSTNLLVKPEDYELEGKSYVFDYRSLVYTTDFDFAKKRKNLIVAKGLNLDK